MDLCSTEETLSRYYTETREGQAEVHRGVHEYTCTTECTEHCRATFPLLFED